MILYDELTAIHSNILVMFASRTCGDVTGAPMELLVMSPFNRSQRRSTAEGRPTTNSISSNAGTAGKSRNIT